MSVVVEFPDAVSGSVHEIPRSSRVSQCTRGGFSSLDQSQWTRDTHWGCALVNHSQSNQCARDSQSRVVRLNKAPENHLVFAGHGTDVLGAQTCHSHVEFDTQTQGAVASILANNQRGADAHPVSVVGEQTPPPTERGTDTHNCDVGGGPILRDWALNILGETLADIESDRIRAENRLRQWTRNEPDSDGEIRGVGLPEAVTVAGGQPILDAAGVVEGLKQLEHDAVLALQRQMRKHPLWPWAKQIKGVGEKTLARLLVTIGDPYWNDTTGAPRTVSQLWAWTGWAVFDGKTQRLRRGQKANWKTKARMRTYLIAESLMKQRSPGYRELYDNAKAAWEGRVEADGSPVSDGHKHAHGLRIVAKQFLKDLWVESRRLHLQKEV